MIDGYRQHLSCWIRRWAKFTTDAIPSIARVQEPSGRNDDPCSPSADHSFDVLSPTVELFLGEGVVAGDLVAQLGAVVADGHHDREAAVFFVAEAGVDEGAKRETGGN